MEWIRLNVWHILILVWLWRFKLCFSKLFYLQVNIYDIDANSFHIWYKLTCYCSVIVHKFTQIYPVCLLTPIYVHLCKKLHNQSSYVCSNWQNNASISVRITCICLHLNYRDGKMKRNMQWSSWLPIQIPSLLW